MSPATFSWTLFEKRKLPKFVNLGLRRGINSNTALLPKIQTSPILAQGIRIARKCNRVKQFISRYSSYLIEWLTEHDSTIYYSTIYRNINKALHRATRIHPNTWKYTAREMWELLSRKIQCQLNNSSTPKQKHRIMLLLKMRELSDYRRNPSAEKRPRTLPRQRNQPVRRRYLLPTEERMREPSDYQPSPFTEKRPRPQPYLLTPPMKRKCQRPTMERTPSLIPNITPPTPWPDAAVVDPADMYYLQDDKEDEKLSVPPDRPT